MHLITEKVKSMIPKIYGCTTYPSQQNKKDQLSQPAFSSLSKWVRGEKYIKTVGREGEKEFLDGTASTIEYLLKKGICFIEKNGLSTIHQDDLTIEISKNRLDKKLLCTVKWEDFKTKKLNKIYVLKEEPDFHQYSILKELSTYTYDSKKCFNA